MRDWLMLLAPLGVIFYFVVFPDHFSAFMAWATGLLG